jgi:hypothetical protein
MRGMRSGAVVRPLSADDVNLQLTGLAVAVCRPGVLSRRLLAADRGPVPLETSPERLDCVRCGA